MNVLVFTSLFPSVRQPSRGIFNLRKFEALAGYCDVRVMVPVPAWRRRPDEWLRTPRVSWGRLTATYPTYWAIPRVAKHLHARAMGRTLRSHVMAIHQEWPIDVILASFAHPEVVAGAYLAAEINRPLVGMVIGSDVNVLARNPVLRPLITWGLRSAEQVIAVSQALKQGVTSLGIPENHVVVQHNGVDGSRFFIRDRGEARRELGLLPDRRLVCYVGNIVREKGPDVLIKAIAHFRRSLLSDVDFVVVGDGALKGEMLAAASNAGMLDRVRFVGRRPPDEIPLWIMAADVLCLPSRVEGCPNVILEALACGRPVVASHVGGVPELLDEENGIMVPSEDPIALADGLRDALQRPWNAEALRVSATSLTWENCGLGFHTVLTNAIASYRSRTGRENTSA